MKKTICRALLCLLLAACLLPLTARTAHADKIYDEIVNYQVDVTPNTEDGSLAIQVTLDWKPLEDLPATNSQQGGAKIGIPNGSIREMTALTDNIQEHRSRQQPRLHRLHPVLRCQRDLPLRFPLGAGVYVYPQRQRSCIL